EPHAAVESDQSDRRDLHPQRPQQRRPVQPGPAARGALDLDRLALTRPALAIGADRSIASAGTGCREGVGMLLTIPNVLTGDQVADAREHLARADLADGRVQAGYHAP